MIKFDRLKLITSIDNIEILSDELFQNNYKGGNLYSARYQQKTPFNLSVEVNYEKREAIIEFSGKILGENYPQLISIDTISECFKRINDLGFCRIDPVMMMDAEVVSCDVTQDVIVEDFSDMIKFIKGNIGNYKAYSCKLPRTGSLTIEKNVVSIKNKKRLIIYDKEKEMNTKNNAEYVTENKLDGMFDDTCRFEMNLRSKEQIRQALKIKDTSLRSVLSSTANPIKDFLEEVMVDDPENNASTQDTWKDYWHSLVLRDCDYDLEKVEAKIRQFKPARNNSIPKMMKPFRYLLGNLNSDSTQLSKQEILRRLCLSN